MPSYRASVSKQGIGGCWGLLSENFLQGGGKEKHVLYLVSPVNVLLVHAVNQRFVSGGLRVNLIFQRRSSKPPAHLKSTSLSMHVPNNLMPLVTTFPKGQAGRTRKKTGTASDRGATSNSNNGN